MARGYEDAYRQFIEPIVGAGAEQPARQAPARATPSIDELELRRGDEQEEPGHRTRVIHLGEGQNPGDTTHHPIYETTTSCSSQPTSRRIQRGPDRALPLLALREPDGHGRRAEARCARRAEASLAFSSGMAATSAVFLGWRAPATSGLQRRDLRRHAAPAPGSLPALASRFAFSSSTSLASQPRPCHRGRRCSGSSRPSTRRCAASTSARSVRPAARPVSVGRRQHLRVASQPAAARMGADLVMHSATKYLGVTVTSPPAPSPAGGRSSTASQNQAPAGSVLDPAGYALARSLKTLALRVAGTTRTRWPWRCSSSSTTGRPRLLPGLRRTRPRRRLTPDERLWRHGVSRLGDDFDAAARLFDRLQVFKRPQALEASTACAASRAHVAVGYTDDQLRRAGVTGDGAPVGRPRRRRRPHRRPGAGTGVVGRRSAGSLSGTLRRARAAWPSSAASRVPNFA